MRSSGTLMALGSGVCFGAMAIFGKLAYDEGATVGTLLSIRFALAALMFWAIVFATGAAGDLRGLGRRNLAIALALGGIGYAAQAGCFFSALERIDAGLLSLLLYTFPAMVAVVAVALGRERFDARKLVALVLASGGLVLVLAGAGAGKLDPLGVALGLGAAVVYTTYILSSQGVSGRLRPTVLSALVCTGATVSLALGSSAIGELRPGDLTTTGWVWLASIALVSTVGAVGLFFAGLRRVGATSASILATVEPVTTVLLAFLVFGETLGPAQLAGGALVLSAVVVLQVRRRPRLSAEPVPLALGEEAA